MRTSKGNSKGAYCAMEIEPKANLLEREYKYVLVMF
jgi:hypothetical protein